MYANDMGPGNEDLGYTGPQHIERNHDSTQGFNDWDINESPDPGNPGTTLINAWGSWDGLPPLPPREEDWGIDPGTPPRKGYMPAPAMTAWGVVQNTNNLTIAMRVLNMEETEKE